MIRDLSNVQIFVKPGITDMRKAINGLAGIIANQIQANQFSGDLYLFCSKNRRIMKALYWDKNGFCLWQKRLEKDLFPWPNEAMDRWEISLSEFKMLMNGIDFFHPHKEIRIEK